MFLSKSKTRMLANLLIWLMFLTNPACIVAAQAVTVVEKTVDTQEDIAKFTVDKSTVEQGGTASSSENYEHLTDQENKLNFSNSLLDYYLQKKQGPKWLETTDVQFSFTEDHKPIYAVESLQPFGKVRDNGSFWFWQGRYAHESDDSSTANLGLGWRKLSADKSSILGVNAFYDYGFEYNLSRIGLGAEYFRNLAEYRVNWYHPVSGDKEIGVSYLSEGILYSYIRAVEGMDAEIGTSFAHIPWLKIYAGGYYWDNKYHEDEKGYKLRSTWQLTPRITMELGYLDSNLSHSSYGQIKYQLADNLGSSLFGKSNKQESNSADISSKLWQKVERENDIKTETYTKLVAYQGNIKVTITNSTSSTPLAGAVVQAYQNGSAVGSAVTTDSSGEALISGLSVGTYTVLATYGGSAVTSGLIAVTKDQTTATTMSLAVSGGSATVTITVNDGANAISGAIVSTTINSTTYSGTTNSLGVAIISGVPTGTYNFTVSATGYTSNTSSITVGASGGSGTIALSGSGGNVSITVNDGTNPISGATVSTIVNGTTYHGTTNGSGIATISGIPTGVYSFNASAANYDDNHRYITVTTTGGSGTISLTGLGNVSITVYDKSTSSADYTGTTPFAGGTVSVTINGTTYDAVVDSSGVATFNNLPVGTYTFKVTAASYSPWIDTTAHKDVTIAVGSTASATISVYGKGGAKVTVTDGTNAPISGATVKFYREGSEAMMTLTTAAAGQVISGFYLPTGTYNVKVTKDASTMTSSYFVVSPGQTTEVSVTLP